MRIATWNVNSIKQRTDSARTWLAERKPDIVCLQETKCVDDAFPRMEFENLGYNVAVHGQKTFNGVAILSKFPFDEVNNGLPGDANDDHARFIEAVVSTAQGALRVASIYLPNGNPPDTEKYTYKIRWMKRLAAYARERLKLEEPLVMAGDYNVIPTSADARNPQAWTGDALFLPKTRDEFRALVNSRSHRRGARDQRRCRPLYVLGLSGRRLAKEQRHPHRSPAAVAARRRPARRRRHRPPRADLGEAVRSRAGVDRSGYRGEVVCHCEPTGPARSGRPDDRLREAIQRAAKLDCFVALLLAMTGSVNPAGP